jgi:hypothetical protein
LKQTLGRACTEIEIGASFEGFKTFEVLMSLVILKIRQLKPKRVFFWNGHGLAYWIPGVGQQANHR